MTERHWTIRQMCEDFGVTARSLRFYEAKQLLSPIREGTKRLYTKRERARLTLILKGKRFGISLEEMRQLLNLYDIGDQQVTQLQRTYQIATARREEMEAQRDALTEALADLDGQLAIVERVLAERGAPLPARARATPDDTGISPARTT